MLDGRRSNAETSLTRLVRQGSRPRLRVNPGTNVTARYRSRESRGEAAFRVHLVCEPCERLGIFYQSLENPLILNANSRRTADVRTETYVQLCVYQLFERDGGNATLRLSNASTFKAEVFKVLFFFFPSLSGHLTQQGPLIGFDPGPNSHHINRLR